MNPVILALLAGSFATGIIWWRQALIWVFILLCVEGLPRLWFGDPMVLLVKDALLLGIYAGFAGALVLGEVNVRIPPVLIVPTLAYVAVALLHGLNSSLGSTWVALAGFKSVLFYIPLIIVTPAALTDTGAVRRFIRQFLLLSIPVCAAGLVQLSLGPQFYAGLGSGFGDAMFISTGYVNVHDLIYRPNSTFAWSGHYGAFLLFSSLLSTGVALAPQARARRWWFTAIAVLNLTAAVMSGQRALFLFLPLALLLILKFHRLRIRMTLVAASLVCVVVAVALLIAGPYVTDRFLSVFEDPADSIVGDYVGAIRFNFANANAASMLGSGLGTASPGSRHVGGFILIENYYAKTRYELGWAGLGLLIWFLGAILAFGWRVGTRTEDPWLRGLTGAIFASSGVLAIWGLVVCMLDFPVFAIPFWGLTGVLVRLSASEPQPARLASMLRPALVGEVRHA